jgi:SAM-dependent methyltransferase
VTVDYSTVTELAGAKASRAQLQRVCNRYYFARTFCEGKELLEVACGAGQGLGYLAQRARRVVGIDIDASIVDIPRRTYRGRSNIEVVQGDAQDLHFRDGSFDVIILYEALYYVPDAGRFVAEAARVLRPGGVLLICTANKDLPDFNPSPYSHRYFGPPELRDLLIPKGFQVDMFGDTPVDRDSVRARVLRVAKAAAVRLDLVPKTMAGKLLLKRFVFGRLVTLPAEIDEGTTIYCRPAAIAADRPCLDFSVIYCVARLLGAPS